MNIWKPTSILVKTLVCTALLLPVVLQFQAGAIPVQANVSQTTKRVDTAPEDLRQYTAEVIQQLALSEPLTSWKNADYVIEPLGPGTRSWLVTVKTEKNAPPGYIIISSTENNEYKLVEYGSGPDSLYVRSNLDSALKASGISKQGITNENVVPLYGGPVLAEWKVKPSVTNSIQFLDALTGELLPESKDSWDKQAAKYHAPELAVGSNQRGLSPEGTIYTSKVFDPYENILWMTEKSLKFKKESFEALLNASKKLVFVSSGAERTYKIPLPIHGYQKWTEDTPLNSNEAIYVLTGSESSSRWISLHALIDCGYFVAYKE